MANIVRFNLDGLDYVRDELHRSLYLQAAGPVQAMLTRWGSRFLAFTRKRYYKMSRGGWTPLAPATIARRKKGKGAGKTKAAILIDHGYLVKALQRGMAGNLFQFIASGVRVGYNSSVKHPRAKSARATFGNIVKWNQEGAGNLPVREILVEPDMQTVAGMQDDVITAINELGKRSTYQ